MDTVLIILLCYLFQALICGIINASVPNRTPRGFKDFFKITFLPWLLLHMKEATRD